MTILVEGEKVLLRRAGQVSICDNPCGGGKGLCRGGTGQVSICDNPCGGGKGLARRDRSGELM